MELFKQQYFKVQKTDDQTRIGTLSTRHQALTTVLTPVVLALFLVFLLPLVASHRLTAQSTNASVSGEITDQQNRVIPETEVEIKNVDTGVTQTTKTNGGGFYSFPALSPGNYLMSVRKQRFQTVSVTGITLHVQDNLSRNFVLQIGSSAESVTVTADSVNINTTDGSVSTVVDRNFVENIPLNGRSLQPLIALTPGVVLTTATNNEPGQFSVNGQRADANYFTVDGVSANFGSGAFSAGQQASGALPAFNGSGGTNSLVSIDSIEEFRVDTSSYSPEFGRTPGGQISIATRSGTNQFHGDVFDYFRNNVLDANSWFYD
jgi:Carboxypeptidase regulatory-like domain/TonB-dependent Receptor Plug Domain